MQYKEYQDEKNYVSIWNTTGSNQNVSACE